MCIVKCINTYIQVYIYIIYRIDTHKYQVYMHIPIKKTFCIGIINTILEPETSALHSTMPQTRGPDQPPSPLLKLVGNRIRGAFVENSNQSEHRTRDSIVTNHRTRDSMPRMRKKISV